MFGGETEYHPFSVSVPLAIPQPRPLADYVLYSILSGTNLSNSLLNAGLSSVSTKVRQLKNYALNHYTLGLPSGTFSSIHMIEDNIVAAAIAADINAINGVSIDFNMVTPLTLRYIVLPYLLDSRGYNIYNNSLSVFPEDMVLETKYLEHHDRTNIVTLNNLSVDQAKTSITIEYKISSKYSKLVRQDIWVDRGTVYDYEWFDLPDQFYTEAFSVASGFHLGQTYCIAGYQINDNEGAPAGPVHWWYYDIASEGHVGFADEATPDEEDNYFFPVVPIRAGNTSMIREELHETELYQTSKKLMAKIGLDIDDVGTSLEESPQISDLDHAYIMFGVELKSEEQAQLQYLTEFFDYVADHTKIGIYDFMGTVLSGEHVGINTLSMNNATLFSTPGTETTTISREVQVRRDEFETVSTTLVNNSFTPRLEDHGLDQKIGFTYIHSTLRAGTIGDGKVGTATVEKQLIPFVGVLSQNLLGWDQSMIIFRRQVTKTAYKEVTVKGLLHFDIIHQGDFRVVTPLSLVITDPDDHSFLVPLYFKLLDRLAFSDRELLVQGSIVLLINGVIEIDIPWYATGIWTFIFAVITIIIIAWTGQAWVAGLAKAANAGLMAVLIYIMPAVLKAIIIGVIMHIVAEVFGPEMMAIIAIVAVAFGMMRQFGPTNLAAAFGNSLPTAAEFLQLASAALGAADAKIGRMIEDISKEYDAFLIDSETKMEELERAAELLAPPDLLALDLLKMQTSRYVPDTVSSPTEFYDLKIHTGNIGTLALDVVPLYCDLSLKLPKFNGLMPENTQYA